MTDKRRIKCWVNTGFAVANKYEYLPLPDDWDAWSEEEQDEHLEAMASEFLCNCIQSGACVVGGDEDAPKGNEPEIDPNDRW